jgi:dTDP-glucose 4,6-dehydratase
MPTALITGAAGSIGCHVVAYLLDNTAWNFVLVDSFRHMGEAPRLVEVMKSKHRRKQRVKVITHDLTTPFSPREMSQIGSIDYIFNLASMSDVYDSLENPVPFVQNNVAVILNVLEFARATKPSVFIQVSTDEVYGPTDGTFLHKEWDPIVPSSPYSASKAAQESIAISYWRAYNVPLVIVNLMNNFGEMQSPKKFPVIVQRKVSDGEPVVIHGSPENDGSRFYIHSSNTADALLFLVCGPEPYLHVPGKMDKPDRYNIPGDAQVSNMEMARLVAGYMGKPLDVRYEDFQNARPGHDRHYGLNGQKLHDFGWKSPRGFHERLQETVRWQMEHPEWLKSSS